MRKALSLLLAVVLTVLSPGPGAIQAFAALTAQSSELAVAPRPGQGMAFSGASALQGAVLLVPRTLGTFLTPTPAAPLGLQGAKTVSAALAEGLAAQALMPLEKASSLEAVRLDPAVRGESLDPRQAAQALERLDSSGRSKAGIYATLQQAAAAASPGRSLNPRAFSALGARLYDGALAQVRPALAAQPVLGTRSPARPNGLLAASQGEPGQEDRDPASVLGDSALEAIALSLLQGADSAKGAAALKTSELQHEVDGAQGFVRRYFQEFDKDIHGQREMKETTLLGILAGGHVLLEGPPGEGKTRAVKAVARMVGLSFSRIQFTPDLMPSDILGQDQLDRNTGEWKIHKGPIFAGVVLADEINRAQPKTQTALLEAMAEHQVTIAGKTYPLVPFFVMATMNPIEQEAVFPLPEAQLDRFMLKVQVPYMKEEGIESVLDVEDSLQAQPLLEQGKVQELLGLTRRIEVSQDVKKYIARLIASTRPDGRYASELVKKYVLWGASSRAAQMLQRAAQAQALVQGRSYVTPEDVKAVAVRVLAHRLVPNFDATGKTTTEQIVRSLVAAEGGVPVSLFSGVVHTDEAAEQTPAPAEDSLAQPQPGASKPAAGLYEKLRAGFAASFFTVALSVTTAVLTIATASAETLNQPLPIMGILEAAPWLAFLIFQVLGPFVAALGLVTLGGLLLKDALPWGRVAKAGLALALAVPLSFLALPWLIDLAGGISVGGFLVMAAGEEAFFRSGVFLPLYNWFKEDSTKRQTDSKKTERVAFIAAGVLSSALFAAFHIPFHGFLLLPVIIWFAGGMLFAHLYRTSGDLITPIAAHALSNIAVLATAGYLSFLWVPVVTTLLLAAWGSKQLGSWWKSLKGLLVRSAAWLGLAAHAIIPLVAVFLIRGAWRHAQDLHWSADSKVMFPTLSLAVMLGAAVLSALVYGLMSGWPARPWFKKSASKKRSFPSAYPMVAEPLD